MQSYPFHRLNNVGKVSLVLLKHDFTSTEQFHIFTSIIIPLSDRLNIIQAHLLMPGTQTELSTC
jgi:hypothetical protein